VNCSIDEEIEIISQRIRGWREQDRLTLQDLAERSGVAPSTIQKVETGQMMPSVGVLLKVARGLGRRITDLVRSESAVTDVMHLTPRERQAVYLGDSMVVERLTGALHKPSIEMWRVSLYPHHDISSDRDTIHDGIQYEGEELVVCEQGSVEFRVGEQSYRLEAGDTLHLKASIPHSWHNTGESLTQFTITSTSPLMFRALMQGQTGGASEERLRESTPRLTAVSA
jgi:transcriptional regulator with XRE-family HTH domain